MVNKLFNKLNYKTANRLVLLFGGLLLLNLLIIFLSEWGHIPLPSTAISAAKRIAIVIGTYFVAALFIRVSLPGIRSVIDKDEQPEQRLLLSKLYSACIYFFASMAVLYQFGATLENIALTIGLFATGFALAIRDVIMSYLSWFILLVKKPFRMGDVVRIGDDTGKVMHIGTFYVLIDESPERKEDYVRIPTRLFLEKPVRNIGKEIIHESLSKSFIKPPKNISAFEKAVLNQKVAITLDTKDEMWVVTASYSCNYSDRKKVRDNITRAMMSTLR